MKYTTIEEYKMYEKIIDKYDMKGCSLPASSTEIATIKSRADYVNKMTTTVKKKRG